MRSPARNDRKAIASGSKRFSSPGAASRRAAPETFSPIVIGTRIPSTASPQRSRSETRCRPEGGRGPRPPPARGIPLRRPRASRGTASRAEGAAGEPAAFQTVKTPLAQHEEDRARGVAAGRSRGASAGYPLASKRHPAPAPRRSRAHAPAAVVSPDDRSSAGTIPARPSARSGRRIPPSARRIPREGDRTPRGAPRNARRDAFRSPIARRLRRSSGSLIRHYKTEEGRADGPKSL